MRKSIAFLVLGVCVTLSFGALRTLDQIDANRPLARNVEEVVQVPWVQMRNAAENDVALTASTRAWNTVDTLFYELPLDARIVQISAYGHGNGTADSGDPAAGSFAYKVYICKKYGSAQLLCTGTWNVGALELTHNPENGISLNASSNYKWCESTTPTEYWPGSVTAGGTSDDIGTISFDPLGYYGIYVEVASIASVSDVTVVMTWTN